MSKPIGIDLGTTNSCVSVVEGGIPVVIPNDEGKNTTPSVVGITKEGHHIVGDAAIRQAVTNIDNTIFSVKRNMGTTWRYFINNYMYSPQEISAIILRKMKKTAENYLGTPVKDAVVTVPAYFTDAQRQATKDAGRIAGLNILRIINEPTSAALAYGLDSGEAQKVMVYDLGGGTFDVSIIEIGENIIEVLATNGDNRLGGDDFDARVVGYLAEQIKSEHRADILKVPESKARLRAAAEQAKKELSYAESTQILLPYLVVKKDKFINFECTLTRETFNALTDDLVERTTIPVKTAMADANITSADLDKVILVGGSTRIPAVQAKVQELTGIVPSHDLNPDECVAQGAAAHAETLAGGTLKLSGDQEGTITLKDITPLTLSIETVGGVATPIIKKNSPLPITLSKEFSTTKRHQQAVDINVLQGERPLAKDNTCIGKFSMKGIEYAVSGIPKIEVTFDIDINGILTVSARDKKTGVEQSITITENDRLSDDAIEEAIRVAEEYSSVDEIRQGYIDANAEAKLSLIMANNLLVDAKKKLTKAEKSQIKFDCEGVRHFLNSQDTKNLSEEHLSSLIAANVNLISNVNALKEKYGIADSL